MREKKGITLIALIITIIVLLIIAGISIGALTSDNSILKRANSAKSAYGNAEELEKIEMATINILSEETKRRGKKLSEDEVERIIKENVGDLNIEVAKDDDKYVVGILDTENYYTIDEDKKVNPIDVKKDNNPGDITKDKDGNDLDGTTKPYEIWSIEDLVSFSNITEGTGYKIEDGAAVKITRADNMQGKKVVLKTNLDFNSSLSYKNYKRTDFRDINGIEDDGNELRKEMTTGTGFKPIKGFKGSFDGENHEIRNIFIDTDQNAALFVSGTIPIIENLGITGKITSSAQQVAGIAVAGSVTLIDNCHNKAEITGGSGTSWCAGICGQTGTGTRITNCYNLGDITNNVMNTGCAGGIVSNLGGNTIIGCYNKGNIVSKMYSGGISNGHGNNKTTVKNCYNTGNVDGGSHAGGILGGNGDVIENCFNTGNIQGNSYGAGITTGVQEIYNCYNTADVSRSYAGGICYEVHKKMINCYNSGDTVKTTNPSGGLIGKVASSDVIIANCFNKASGECGFNSSTSGIVGWVDSGTVSILNCYSIGESFNAMYNGSVYRRLTAGLVGANSGTVTLNKGYYLKTDVIVRAMNGTEDTELDVTGLNNKSEITAAILNANISSMPDVGKELVRWIDGPNGYPILDFSQVEGFPQEQ